MRLWNVGHCANGTLHLALTMCGKEQTCQDMARFQSTYMSADQKVEVSFTVPEQASSAGPSCPTTDQDLYPKITLTTIEGQSCFLEAPIVYTFQENRLQVLANAKPTLNKLKLTPANIYPTTLTFNCNVPGGVLDSWRQCGQRSRGVHDVCVGRASLGLACDKAGTLSETASAAGGSVCACSTLPLSAARLSIRFCNFSRFFSC